MSSDITKERIERIRQYYTPNPDNKPCVRPSGDDFVALCDLALKAVTPPATAKLPEGVEIVETNAHPKFDVRTATQYLGRDGRWRKRREDDDNVGCFGTREEALTAALAAPPVPGEKPTNKPDMLRVTVGDGKYTLVQDGEGKQFALRYGEPWRDLVGDGLTLSLGYELDAARARIAELEADNTRLRAQYDMVEQERTRLMLGQQVPYTPAEKPDPLARAVTVGEMLRLADNLKKGDLYFLCNHIRRVFTPPQGASHAE